MQDGFGHFAQKHAPRRRGPSVPGFYNAGETCLARAPSASFHVLECFASMKRDPGRLVVLDESSSLRTAAARALRDAGYDVQSCGTVDEALRAADGPPVSLVLASSTLIAKSAQSFDRLLSLSRRPHVLFSCPQTRRCPLDPEVSCQYLGCLLKPNDFTPETLVGKVRAALA
jgi:hypothetical protein